MPTARGLGVLLGAALLWAAGRALGIDELLVVATVAAALPLLALVGVRVGGGALAVRRRLRSDRLAHDAHEQVALDLRNDGRLPTSTVLAREVVPDALASASPRWAVAGLRPGATIALPYRIAATQRGRHHLGPAELTVTDRLGLALRRRRTSATTPVLVYPPIESLPEALGAPQRRGSADGARHRLLNLGDEFHTLREYVEGDDLRRVHWPSTARRGKVMIRQHELPWHAEATLLLDTRAPAHRGAGDASTLEAAISCAASAARHLADRRFLLRLTTEADERSPRVQDVEAILERLALLDASPARSLASLGERLRRSAGEGLLLACVTPPPGRERVADAADSRALLQAGSGFASRAAVIVHDGQDAQRAQQLVALLRAASWRAVARPVGTPLAEVWPGLGARPSAAGSAPAATSATPGATGHEEVSEE